jgi:SAM-dependent methyltransferase
MTFALARRLVTIGLGLLAAYAVSRQCRRPSGWLGRRLARAMNVSHSRVTTWGLGHVTIESRARILDIGCGGGRTLSTLAAMASDGHVDGVDYAPASVAIARETNADLIQSGRAAVHQASVSNLPFADASFDLVTAVETHYYWPSLTDSVREVLRVLAPGGRFVIIAETYKGRSLDWIFGPVMRWLLRATYLTPEEHRAVLIQAGFHDVQIDTLRSRGWLCVIGTCPASP